MAKADAERAEALIAVMESRIVDRVVHRGEHFIDAFRAEYGAACDHWRKTEQPAVVEIATRAGCLTTPVLRRIAEARESMKPQRRGWFKWLSR